MKVLKFGGTSVGTIESILSLKKIVESKDTDVIVVVSALGGITDRLILCGNQAAAGDTQYIDTFSSMRERHFDMIDAIITDPGRHEALMAEIIPLFDSLRALYDSIYAARKASRQDDYDIVSYGERLSSRIVTALIEGAVLVDSLEVIKTETLHGKEVLQGQLTNKLISERLSDHGHINIMPGFISTNAETGAITNLGRGGSDYTAAIIAGALHAECLEIWTDVNGFLTADPRIVSEAHTIPELTYDEAMELCHFGAKVIYPPTLYPVCAKSIPILVKNTFAPEHPGTIIKERINPIRGISGSKGISLIKVETSEGTALENILGVNRRIFTSLSDRGVSVHTLYQQPKTQQMLISVSDADSDEAVECLNGEFSRELAKHLLRPITATRSLASVAIIGTNIRTVAGLRKRLINTLVDAGIQVHSLAENVSQTSLSAIVDGDCQSRAFNAIHSALIGAQ